MSNFIKFGGQTPKNIHDVRKACLEATLGVNACFVEFYLILLDETHFVGPNHLFEHICVGNDQVRLHIRPKRGPKGGP